MSEFKKHLIIYSRENQQAATRIANTLRGAGHEAMILEKSSDDYSQQVGQTEAPAGSAILFLMTDNFLKSYGCMNGILQAAHKWGDGGQLSIIVDDGVETDEDDQEHPVTTRFERVGEIIQYMNFWQDNYLSLRKEKRSRQNDEELEEKLAITKEISGDVGEFLRYVRGLGYFSVAAFYQTVLKDQEALPEGAAILASANSDSTTGSGAQDERSLVEMIEDSSEELMAENRELKGSEATSDELTEEVLNSIPGLDMLPDDAEEVEENEELDAILEDGELSTGQAAIPSEAVEHKGHFTDKEIEKLDQENEELLSILDEVLEDEAGTVEVDKDEFHFVGDDPDHPEDFNIDALFEGDENIFPDTPGEAMTDQAIDEKEIEVNLLVEGETEEVETADSTDNVLEQAVEFFRQNEHEKGIAHLAESVTSNPGDTSLRYYHAYALARYASSYEEAENELTTLLEQDASHPDAWFLKAELAENRQEYDNARHCFEKVLEANPTFPEAQYRMGLILTEQFENEEVKAASHLIEAIRQNDKNVDALYLLATLQNEHLQQPENAIKNFRKALKLQPSHPFANYDLALVYHKMDDTERAAEFYAKAVTLNPELKTEQNDQAFGAVNSPSDTPEEAPEEVSANEPSVSIAAEDPEMIIEEEDSIEEILTSFDSENGEEKEEAPVETAISLADEDAPVVKTKLVLITGATAGIGRATAELFARNGYRLIVTGRRADRLKNLSEEFAEKYQSSCHYVSFDVRDPDAVKEQIEQLPEEWKNVDILINNAGLSRGMDPIHEGKLEDWENMIDTNVKGLLYMTRAITPSMVERKSGHIINVSSIAGTEVYPGGNVYCASKAAVSSLTRSMRLDLHKHNIRVSQVAPGHVEQTEFARVRYDWDTEKAAKTYEDFQPLTSGDIAETIYFIASRPAHVNIVDIYLYGTQQASATMIDRSGR